jgi:8-oxo-dGTP pyrophosphatase MutT (NUDIX family)
MAISASIRQASVIPTRSGRVCLVQSRSGKRWVLPKGHIEPGQTAGEAGLQEAWEEAGLVGVLHREPVGSYLYRKRGKTCHVVVFLMRVTQETSDWPECRRRPRRWVSPARALRHISNAGLRSLLREILANDPVAVAQPAET